MKYLKNGGLFLLGLLFIASCTKENILETEEKVEPIDYNMEIKIGTRSITTDAFALYCSANGKEEFRVSNNEDLLGIFEEGDFSTLESGDYIFMLRSDGEIEYALGGGFYTADVTGLDADILSITPDLEYSVASNDDATVIGTLSGEIFLIDVNGNTAFYDLDVEYTAEIIGQSPFCD